MKHTKKRISFVLNPCQIQLMAEALNDLLWTYGTKTKDKEPNKKLAKQADDMITQFRQQATGE